jgi:hypothetical protein
MVHLDVQYNSFMETRVTSPNKKQTERITIILKNCFCDGSWNFNNLFINFDNNSLECHKIELVLVSPDGLIILKYIRDGSGNYTRSNFSI